MVRVVARVRRRVRGCMRADWKSEAAEGFGKR